jgi:hypothetical protein
MLKYTLEIEGCQFEGALLRCPWSFQRVKLKGIRKIPPVGNQEPLNHLALYNRTFHDFRHILKGNLPIPDPFGIDHQDRTVQTCVQASGIIRSDDAGQTMAAEFCLQRIADSFAAPSLAASFGMIGWTLVNANEYVTLISTHSAQYVVVMVTSPLILARQAARSFGANPRSSISLASNSEGGVRCSFPVTTVTLHHPQIPSPEQDCPSGIPH